MVHIGVDVKVVFSHQVLAAYCHYMLVESYLKGDILTRGDIPRALEAVPATERPGSTTVLPVVSLIVMSF